jgi:ketosteroid isomerase-like protein
MNSNDLISQFYSSFARGNADGMNACYHENVEFEDPAFGILNGDQVRNMWRMLIEKSKGNIKITTEDIKADEMKGSAVWVATYYFGNHKRKVVNRIQATFEFSEGKIIRHKDQFDFWKWSRQALGWKGFLLGWTPVFKAKVRSESRKKLLNYITKK